MAQCLLLNILSLSLHDRCLLCTVDSGHYQRVGIGLDKGHNASQMLRVSCRVQMQGLRRQEVRTGIERG
jgi:hypothetical protein